MHKAPPHTPVLLTEIIEILHAQPPREILDVTFGRGGHTREILKHFPNAVVTALDQDPAAIAYGKVEFSEEIASGRLMLMQKPFTQVEAEFPTHRFDFILADLGVSSPQLDEAARGFSFYQDGPLDMRMDPTQDLTAAQVINKFTEDELNQIFLELGEVRNPARVTRAIVADRTQEPFTSTRQLASLIERIEGWRKKGLHPATLYFLGLRLYVNQELTVLRDALPMWMYALKPGGRLAVISFHSLEDRIVKYFMKDALDQGRLVNKKVIQAKWSEKQMNPRARSAKLRVFEREKPQNDHSHHVKSRD